MTIKTSLLFKAVKFLFSYGLSKLALFAIQIYSSIRPPLQLLDGVAPVDQSTSERLQSLSDIVTKYFPIDKPLLVLEIGTWFGLGSSSLLSSVLPRNSQLVLLDKWKPYINQSDKSHKLYGYAHMDNLHEYALLSASSLADNVDSIGISILKSDSLSSSQFLAPGSFNLVYIDGSHYYSDVLNDLHLAKQLVCNDFAVICGDDLEIPIQSEEHIHICRKLTTIDYTSDSYGRYHPGVSLAVHEVFGEVNVKDGFWWIFLLNGNFVRYLSD